MNEFVLEQEETQEQNIGISAESTQEQNITINTEEKQEQEEIILEEEKIKEELISIIEENNQELEISLFAEIIPPELEDLEVTPSKQEQNFKSTKYGFDNVKVKPIETENLYITPSKQEQNFEGLFGVVNVNQISPDYIIPTGNIDIVENGTYDVTDKATATVNVPTGGSQYPIIEGTGKHEVRFIDYDGTILKIQYLNDGESATAPQTPEHERLTFVEWNREYDNVTHDLDIGALYTTTSGNTELFIEVTEETGLKVTLNMYKGTETGMVTIDWGDGTTTNARITTSRSVTHTYTNYGEYMISIIGSFGYALGGTNSSKPVLKGANEVSSNNLLKKCYCSSYVSTLKSYCFFNNFNLEEFTASGLVEIVQYVFYGTKQKTLFIPKGVTRFQLYTATNCTNLKYLVLCNNITTINSPAVKNCDIEKMIYPEDYELTTYGYGVFYNGTKYFWYKKPSVEYSISSNFAVSSIFLEKIPMYENLINLTGYGNFSYCNIKKIAFPPSLQKIENGIFTSCGNLTDVYMYAHTPPTLTGTSVFTSANPSLRIHVYPEDLATYQTATNWSTASLKSRIVGDLEGEFKDGYY